MYNAALAQSKLITPRIRKISRLALISFLVFLFSAALFIISTSQAHLKTKDRLTLQSKQTPTTGTRVAKDGGILKRWNEIFRLPNAPSFLVPVDPAPDLVETFASDCTTPKTAFVFGDTICAKISGGPPLALYPRKFAWVSNDNFIQQRTDISSDPQTDSFTLPAAGGPIDYRGVWRVNSISAARSAVRASAFITVSDPANPAADLLVYKGNNTDGSITAGSNIEYVLWLANKGPDTASNVQVTDLTPDNTTFLSGNTDDANLNCTFPAANSSGGTTTCTLASLAAGAHSSVTLVVNVNSGTSPGTVISNTASISSDTPDPHGPSSTDGSNNNSQTSDTVVIAGAASATCTLDCPEPITANANTTENNQRGAHVTFDVTATGDCGTVTATPASGSFFPVGTTVVNVSSGTGGGSCSFTVTINDTGTNPPTISCPANQTANADSNCQATVTLGAPTVTGDNVTIVGVRSDGQPMYNCDCFPNSPDQANDSCNIFGGCSRKNPDLPFATGVTTVAWQAISHDTPGPYTTPADEEAHRTGTASCTQTVTVNDVTPPVITATDQTVSADANCMAAVPDYSNNVTDNCACASSDTSQDCVGQHRITLTQDPAAGTLVGLGQHTIHLTANDGSSNNGGAGNTSQKDITLTVADTTPPTITCPGNITRSNDTNQCYAMLNPGTATATDNCDSNPTITGTRSDNQSLSAPYPVGTTTITWRATDFSNNSSTCTQTIIVNDTQPPVITCPGNITLEPTCPSGAIATYTTPVGTDNCPGAVTTRTAGFASGSIFPIGTTTVTYSVTDAHNNGPVSCSFTVTVKTPQATIQDMINAVNAISSLSGTQKQGLIAKLQAVLDAINQGKTNVACNNLKLFISQVSAYIGNGTLTSAQGTPLLNSANHVKNTIGCTNDPCT